MFSISTYFEDTINVFVRVTHKLHILNILSEYMQQQIFKNDEHNFCRTLYKYHFRNHLTIRADKNSRYFNKVSIHILCITTFKPEPDKVSAFCFRGFSIGILC